MGQGWGGAREARQKIFPAPSKKSPPHGAGIFLDGAGNFFLFIRKKRKNRFCACKLCYPSSQYLTINRNFF
tara:strand:+ start:158 stop:370 length:213 start_codon:yes stop_codon:yes gene_type:complete